MLAGERLEQLDRRRAARERGAAGLVAERDGDLGVRVADERLDEVELGRRAARRSRTERAGARPRRRAARRARRGRGRRRRSRRAPPAGGGRRSTARRARPRAAARCPPPATRGPRRRTARGRRASAGARRTGPPSASGKPGPVAEARELAQLDVADRRADDAAARQPAERPPAHPGGAGDVTHQARERRDLGAEHEARAGELAGVVAGVGGGRHDEHRVARQRGAEALEDGARLGGVGRTGDQREWHRRPHRFARAPAGKARRRPATPRMRHETVSGRMFGSTTTLRVATLSCRGPRPEPLSGGSDADPAPPSRPHRHGCRPRHRGGARGRQPRALRHVDARRGPGACRRRSRR